MNKKRQSRYLDVLAVIRKDPLRIPQYFYVGQECPHGHYKRHKKDHWCLDCVTKIQLNSCGADATYISEDHRWCYWVLLPYLKPGTNLNDCWIVPSHLRSDNENKPVYRTYTYNSGLTGNLESIQLSRFIYFWFWGDVGAARVTRTCDNKCCWNPLHLKSVFNVAQLPTKIHPLNLKPDILESNRFVDKLKQRPKTLIPSRPRIIDPRFNANIKVASPFRPLEEIPLEKARC